VLVGLLIAVVAATLGVGAVLLVSGGGSGGKTPSVPAPPKTTTTTQAPPAPVTHGQAAALADEYASAYSAKSTALLRAILAPDFTRKNAGDPTQNRAQALATYESQFKHLTNPHYDLSGLSIQTAHDTATVRADYRITSAAGTVEGSVVIVMARVHGKLLIKYIHATPKAPKPPAGGGSTEGNTGSTTPGSGGSNGGSGSSGDGGGLLWYGNQLPPPDVPNLY
jgi:hypothetical protein